MFGDVVAFIYVVSVVAVDVGIDVSGTYVGVTGCDVVLASVRVLLRMRVGGVGYDVIDVVV